MKRACKILTLILIVVFVLSVFAGCDLVGRNIAKYRSTVAMTVGDQKITIGKLLDTFNSYYNNYYYYISAGYLTTDSLLEMAISSLTQQYIQIDDYVKNHSAVTMDLKNGNIPNAEFLTLDQFAYCIEYVKHASFTTFDGTVLTNLSVNRDIGDAETEDTSRNFTEYDELLSETSYAEHLLKQNFYSKEAKEYFEKYYAGDIVNFDDLDKLASDYVYTEATKEAAQVIIDELNDRIENEDEKIDFDEYVAAQEKAVKQYRDTIKTNYGISLEEFMQGQVADMVSSCILALWSYEKYEKLADKDFVELLKKVDATKSQDQAARFAIKEDFDSFITGLSSSDFIYNVPQDMEGKYVFVKNILIPFASEQSAWLSAQSDSYGGTDTEAYKKLRDSTATQIAAEYFYNEKYEESIEALFAEFLHEDEDEDAESKYEKISGVFTDEGGKLAVNPTGVLGSFFGADGVVTPMDGKTNSETIVELMKRFNTDTAQHTSRYGYVVYVGDDWKDYSHNWVEEFYTAVNELGHDEATGKFNESNIGKYAMCVSTYGVHIIYVEGFVENYVYKFNDIDWTLATSWNDTSSLNYVRYKAEFNNKVNKVTQDAYEALEVKYIEDGKITINSQFKRFLKDNDFTFDFADFLEERLTELK